MIARRKHRKKKSDRRGREKVGPRERPLALCTAIVLGSWSPDPVPNSLADLVTRSVSLKLAFIVPLARGHPLFSGFIARVASAARTLGLGARLYQGAHSLDSTSDRTALPSRTSLCCQSGAYRTVALSPLRFEAGSPL